MLETIRVVWWTWSARFFELIGSAVLCNMLWCASFLEDSLWMICFLSFRQLNWNLLIFWMFSPDSSIIFYSCKGPLPLFLSCEKFYNTLVTSVNSMPFNALSLHALYFQTVDNNVDLNSQKENKKCCLFICHWILKKFTLARVFFSDR